MLSYQKELRIIFVFLFLLTLFALSLLFINSFVPEIIIVLLLLFGSFFYGLYSKNPILAGLLGALFPIIFAVFLFHNESDAEIQRVFSYYVVETLIGLFTGLFSGFSAYFLSKKDSLCVPCFILSLIFVFAGIIHFLSGIN